MKRASAKIQDPVETKQKLVADLSALKPDDDSIKEGFQQAEEVKNNHFKCSICQYLLWEPVKCERCHHMFCKACINEVKRSNHQGKTKCPIDGKLLSTAKLTPIERTSYEYTVVNGCSSVDCEKYGQEMTIAELLQHISRCLHVTVKCPLDGCGHFYNPRRALEHLDQVCESKQTSCQHCKEKISYAQQEEHVCLTRLMHLYQAERARSEGFAADIIYLRN